MAERIFSLSGATMRRAKADGTGDLTVDMAFASDKPYERWWGVEILDMAESSVRLGRLNDGDGGPVLYNHNWNDLRGRHVPGSVKVSDDGVLRGQIVIPDATQTTRDTQALVESKTLSKASVGYTVHTVIEQTTAKSGERQERRIDGALFERLIKSHSLERDGRVVGGDVAAFRRALDEACGPVDRAKDDPPVYRVVDWEPMENSLVTVPADNSVGVGRSAEHAADVAGASAQLIKQVSQPAAPAASTERKATMADNQAAAGAVADRPNHNDPQPQGGSGLPAQVRQGPSALDLEQDRVKSIDNLCKANNIDPGVRNVWVTSGASIHQISEQLLTILQRRSDAAPKATQVGLTDAETRSFRLSRAIEACAAGNWTEAGFEAEVSRTIAQKLGRAPNPNRFFVPWEVQQRQNMTPIEALAYQMMKRDLTVAAAGAGGYLKETANVGFIELLRNKSVLFNMGARRLSGLQGDVTIPKQSVAGTAVWLANEASTITESQQTFVQVAMSPKNVGGYTEISRQLLLQSSPSAEGIVMADLAAVVALDIDLKGLNGSGASGQPTGILNTAGIGSVTGTSLAYAGVLEFQTDVFGGNALTGNSGYVTTGAVAALMKQRVKFTSTASPLWEGRLEEGTMDGYHAMASNQVPSATMLFGDFDLGVLVAEWGVLELEVNPYANFQAGIVGVRAMASVDIAVRYPTAFSAASSIT